MSDERVCGVLGVNGGGHTTLCIRAYPCEKHGELPAVARYRKALEELRDAADTYQEAADKPCGDQTLDMVRLAFIAAFNTMAAIATRALTEEERDDDG